MEIIILGSGSKGNSTLVITKTKKFLIDVGFSLPKTKMILEKHNLTIDDIDFILLTHNHKDHTIGLASLIKKSEKFLYVPKDMYKEIKKTVEPDYIIPVLEDDIYLDDLHIKFLHTSHDAVSPVGFLIEEDTSLIYMTDTGYISRKNLKQMHNKDLYIIESNHDPKMLMDGPYPYVLKQRVISDTGHLSNEMTGNYLKDLIGDKTKQIILAHLSETNNLEELAIETVSSLIDSRVPVIAARQESELVITI